MVIAFLLGLIVGAGALYFISYAPMTQFRPIEDLRNSIRSECPYGMRKHFNETTGGYGCVPDDYIGI